MVPGQVRGHALLKRAAFVSDPADHTADRARHRAPQDARVVDRRVTGLLRVEDGHTAELLRLVRGLFAQLLRLLNHQLERADDRAEDLLDSDRNRCGITERDCQRCRCQMGQAARRELFGQHDGHTLGRGCREQGHDQACQGDSAEGFEQAPENMLRCIPHEAQQLLLHESAPLPPPHGEMPASGGTVAARRVALVCQISFSRARALHGWSHTAHFSLVRRLTDAFAPSSPPHYRLPYPSLLLLHHSTTRSVLHLDKQMSPQRLRCLRGDMTNTRRCRDEARLAPPEHVSAAIHLCGDGRDTILLQHRAQGVDAFIHGSGRDAHHSRQSVA